jgi:2-polyprenyl-6-hydroxyphenyl methylase/3-demethylubiquinone-9 3-methyltransferase
LFSAPLADFLLSASRMPGYYTQTLSAERLRACYDLAPPRTKAYLEAEIQFVLTRTSPRMVALELGCGYGRVLRRLLPRVHVVFGIDTSFPSLRMASDFVGHTSSLRLACMDAARMGFRDRMFDLTICIQNGISAFSVDQRQLFAEAVRVTRAGGLVVFSSYSAHFWEPRLEWFEVQAAHGLIGAIDYRASGNGVIVCKDGFRATTVDAESFERLAAAVGLVPRITEVDNSSVFCEMSVLETPAAVSA